MSEEAVLAAAEMEERATRAQFLLFSGRAYYPRPGWGDFVRRFATLEDAAAEGRRLHAGHEADGLENAWWQVVDLMADRVAASGGVWGDGWHE
jgi:hypothetical protein